MVAKKKLPRQSRPEARTEVLPMSEDPPDPPRKFYSLKPREFDAINGPPRTAPTDALDCSSVSPTCSVSALPPPSAGGSPIVMLYGLACGGFMTAALIWIMCFVMDDY